MKFVITLLLTFITFKVRADIPGVKNRGDAESIMKTGRYVTVTLFLGTPMRIYVAGKERAKLDLSNLRLEVSQYQGGAETLEINRDGNYYVVKNSEPTQDLKMIEVKTVIPKKKTETFRFRLKKP